MKVYVIQKGCYSDRHIIGIVETMDEAIGVKKAILKSPYDDDITIEEYDTEQFQTNRMRFLAEYYTNGSWNIEYDDHNIWENFVENSEIWDNAFIIYANSNNQALKIAQDMHAQKEYEQLEKEELI